MADVETMGYAIIDGVIRKVKIFPGGLFRDGKHLVIAAPFNPKKATKAKDSVPTARLLIDPLFVSSSMEELAEKTREVRLDTLKALTSWPHQ